MEANKFMSNLLIVDDEQNLVGLFQRVLRLKGYEIEIATTGYEAIEKAKKNQFDLCLLDIILPDISGVEVFLKIKEISPNTRVIMMTGFAVEELIEQAINNGAYACIHKPFDIDKILEIIEETLKSQKRIILIADNVENVRKKIISLLKNRCSTSDRKFLICEAISGNEVLEKVARRHYDIILLDYGLPDMNGIQVFLEAKKINPDIPDIVVILMLDSPLNDIINDALISGFYGWLKKPVEQDDLFKLINGME